MYCITSKFVKLKPLTTCRNHLNRVSSSLSKKSNILCLIENMPHEDNGEVEMDESKDSNKITTASVEVIGSGADGVPACVVLKTCLKNYLINCGEGTQKLSNEYKIKLSKSPDIFITSPTWKNISGLLGTVLTLQDCHVPHVTIHGHHCIGNIFSSVNKFTNLRSLQINVINCTHYKEYTDGLLLVKYISLHSSTSPEANENALKPETIILNKKDTSESEAESTDEIVTTTTSLSSASPSEEQPVHKRKNKKKRAADKRNDLKNKPLQAEVLQKPAVSYIFTIESTPGALDWKKCMELGVPAGPLLGELKRGKDVTLPNGIVVKSEEVRGPNLPCVTLIAVECPSEDFLDSLINEPIFYKYQSGDNIAGTVIHFTSSQVVKNLKYQNWIKRFPQQTKHLFINEDNNVTGSVAIHRQQFKLNLLEPDMFPLLYEAGIPDFPRRDHSITECGHSIVPDERDRNVQIYSDSTFYKCDTNNFIKGETLCTLYLKPRMAYDYSKCLVLKKDEFMKEVYQPDMEEKIEKSREALQELSSKLQLDTRIYPKIVFLGTGSGKPSKVRNASGILIFAEEDKCILFDCGENTYNQLVTFYGKQRSREILRNLFAVFISHLHVDHHFGLISILKERKIAFSELNECVSDASSGKGSDQGKLEFKPVYILAPLQINRWLQVYNDEFENISHLYDLIGSNFPDERIGRVRDLVEACKDTLNLKSLLTVPVCHCPNAFGISIVHEDGWKITYSGDTRPCEALVELGMDSDILIHEATFEDAYRLQAKRKLHSTTYEAIDVGKKMRAKYILLTHFSQRYCYLPNIEEEFSLLNIGIAFDYMEVPFNKLPILPALLTPLQNVFSEYDEKVKSISKTTQMKRERSRSVYTKNSSTDDEKPAKISKRSLRS